MTKVSWICFVVLFVFAFSACEDHGGGGGGGGVSEVIGPEGGSITSRDGRLTLTFPPGALTEDTEIIITDIKGGEVRVESDGLEPQFTYHLEPDGIEFNAPVTASFPADETPVQGDGSIVTEGALLYTSSNGQIELLENLTQEVNADEDTTSVSGELSHFSELSGTGLGIKIIVSGVPDSLPVGGTFIANVLVENIEQKVAFDLKLDPQYNDNSTLPIMPLFKSPRKVFIDDVSGEIAEGEFKYQCVSAGQGKYSATTTVFYISSIFGETEEIAFSLGKGVKCETGPSPTPPPVCAKVGTYSSMSAGCGIGMFTVSDITSGELTVTGFGANPGDVKFTQLPLEPTVFSSTSSNLIIFDRNGHGCTLTCGPEDNQLTLNCENPPNMCTEVFTLQ